MKKLRISSKKKRECPRLIQAQPRNEILLKFYCIVFEKIMEMQILLSKSASGFKRIRIE